MNETLKGSLLVMLGATCYGFLASIVKLSYAHGYTTTEVIFSQFLIGILCVWVLKSFQKQSNTLSKKEVLQLLIFGTSLGFTSVFYYLSVLFLNASVAVVLLMQAVGFGVIYESIITKKFPERNKVFALILIAIGTVWATDLLQSSLKSNQWILGFVFGLLSAISFTVTLIGANSIATQATAYTRTYYMLLGGGIVTALFGLLSQWLPYGWGWYPLPDLLTTNQPFDYTILWNYGLLLALFGTILPIIFHNKGFPKISIGLGSILSALELPISDLFTYLIINEEVKPMQWIGIGTILLAVLLINKNHLKKKSIHKK